MIARNLLAIAALLLALPLLAGCTRAWVVTARPYPGAVVVKGSPPEARVEVTEESPGDNYTWVDGYWTYRGNWVWQAGHWVVRVDTHARWVRGYWVNRRGAWVWIEGYWNSPSAETVTWQPGHWEQTPDGWVWVPGRWMP